jgi:hypothetical protein
VINYLGPVLTLFITSKNEMHGEPPNKRKRNDSDATIIAVERLGAADTPCLQGNGLRLDAASRILAYAGFVGTAGAGRQLQ